MKNYYKILGVRENASEKQIRTQWIKLMREFHHDQRGEQSSNALRIKEINEAYNALKHSSNRAEYDVKRIYEQRRRRSGTKAKVLFLGSVTAFVVIALAYIFLDPLSEWIEMKRHTPSAQEKGVTSSPLGGPKQMQSDPASVKRPAQDENLHPSEPSRPDPSEHDEAERRND